MKTLFATVSCLLGCLVLAPNAQAVEKGTLAVEAFIKGCARAAAGREQKLFKTLEPLSVDDRPSIKLFKLRTADVVDIDVVAMVDRGADAEIEVPRITTVCINNVEQPTMYGGKTIEFASNLGETIRMGFHLGNLRHTTWQPKANDSIWMTDDPIKYPDASSWPDCMGGIAHKNVHGTAKELYFRMCSNPSASGALSYRYELILLQTSSDHSQVDVGIDPQIINHPH